MTVNTTWVSPVSATLDKTTGNVIDEAMTDAWSSDLYHLGGTAGYIGCRATSSSAQSISNSTLTAVAFASESFDSDPNGAMHDNATNNSRITIRTAGLYHLGGYVQFASNATGERLIGFAVNGVSITADRRPAASSGVTQAAHYAAYALSASDYVELQVLQTSGGALNVDGGSLTAVKA